MKTRSHISTTKPGFLSVMQSLQPGQLLPALSIGVISAVIGIMVQISLAALIYSGDLAPYLGAGIGYFLFGTFALALVCSLTSSFPSTLAFVQDTPTVLLALAAVALLASLPATADAQARFYSVVAMTAFSSLLAGLLFLLLGRFQLGNLIRYLPYPVVGGFLAGTGWLLTTGAIAVMTDMPVTLAAVPSLGQPALLLRWLPGLVLATATLLILRRSSHFLILPTVLVVAIGLFYLALAAQGLSAETARAQGWLLGPFPAGSLWTPLSPTDLAHVQWLAILGQSGAIATLLLLSLICLLLNVSGLELATGRDLDLNRELRAVGLANLVSGLGGGPVGYHWLGLSALVHRTSPGNRIVGVIFALLYGLALIGGTALLSYVPTLVVGGLLLFLGLSFLAEWLYDAYFKLAKTDYAIVLAIALAMSTVGVLAGVGLGILLAVALFVIDYSRLRPVKHTLSGTTYRSNVDRPPAQHQLLCSHGDEIHILQLQGFLFFGSAHNVLEQLRRRLAETDRSAPRFVVLDFRQAHSLDASAALSIGKMVQVAQRHGFLLLFSHLSPAMHRQLGREVLTAATQDVWRTFPDLDHAVEWAEEQILLLAQRAGALAPSQPFPQFLTTFLDGRPALVDERQLVPNVAILMQYLERFEAAAGHYLIHQGEEPQGLYFIARGQTTAQLEMPDGRSVRLRTMQAGTVIGELGLYAGGAASASVVALTPSMVYFLSAERLAQMEQQAPQMAAALHKAIARTVSERLIDATSTVRTLLA